MELNIKFDEKMIVETANRVLDEYEYKGKTIREWADLIAHPKTKADLIRTMSDEELAEWIISITEDDTEGWLDWLKQEVEKTDE